MTNEFPLITSCLWPEWYFIGIPVASPKIAGQTCHRSNILPVKIVVVIWTVVLFLKYSEWSDGQDFPLQNF